MLYFFPNFFQNLCCQKQGVAYTPVFTALISNSLSKIYLVDGLPGLLPMGQVRRESYLPKRNLYLSGRADRGFLNPDEWFSYIFERVIRQQIKKSILEMIQKGAVPENIHTLPQKRLIKVGEFFKTKTFKKKCIKLYWNLQRDAGSYKKSLLWVCVNLWSYWMIEVGGSS